MAYRTLKVEIDNGVGWLVFARPESGNAMNAEMFAELEHAWLSLDSDDRVAVIVNTGEGPAFQTGLDLQELTRTPEALREVSRQTRDAALRFTAWHLGVGKPVIAAVNGVCAGGGLHFVADADIVVAASTATFVDPHVSVGQVSAYETIALAMKAPFESITRLALTGRHERLTAARAYQLGLVSQVVEPPDRLRAEAGALAEKIARNSGAAMRLAKRDLWRALEGVHS